MTKTLIVGLDEAGYGPNLGPFIMTMTGLATPHNSVTDFWQSIPEAVVQPGLRSRGRLQVGDSKKIHKSKQPDALEKNVLPFLMLFTKGTLDTSCLPAILSPTDFRTSPASWEQLPNQLPCWASVSEVQGFYQLLATCLARKQIEPILMQSIVVHPSQFNEIIADQPKSVVLEQCLIHLLRLIPLDKYSKIEIVADRHGGKKFYEDTLRLWLPNHQLVTKTEEIGESSYVLKAGHTELLIKFTTKADNDYFCVALASMVSKYLRELYMASFNAFWQQQDGSLKPTAGYPVDARRFYQSISHLIQQHGISQSDLWRIR